MLRWSLSLVVVGLVPAGGHAGCGDSEEDKATKQVRSARNDISKVKKLQALTITTAPTSQVRENLQAIRDDLSTISAARAAATYESTLGKFDGK